MTDDRSREAVVVAERFADGRATWSELIVAFNAAQRAWNEIPLVLGWKHGKAVKPRDGSRAAKRAAEVARHAADPGWDVRAARQAAWRQNPVTRCALANHLRDLFGNPFRPVAAEPSWLSWNGHTIPKMAQGIYDGSDFDRLPILADAIEEAGCSHEGVLWHCRKPETHVRGCWLVDLLLGKGQGRDRGRVANRHFLGAGRRIPSREDKGPQAPGVFVLPGA